MRRRQHGVAESPFLGSITDLMTSLAVIFILLLVYFVCELAKVRADYEKQLKLLSDRMNVITTVKKELKDGLAKKGYVAQDDPNDILGVVYRASADKLKFEVDKDALNEEGKAFLQRFIPTMVNVINSPLSESARRELHEHTGTSLSKYTESIIIEGHTDSSGEDKHNLQLSQGRAFAVMRYGIDLLGNPHQREYFLRLTSINGRGWRGLIAKPGSKIPEWGVKPGTEDMDKSRRVEFKIRVKSVEQNMQALKPEPVKTVPSNVNAAPPAIPPEHI